MPPKKIVEPLNWTSSLNKYFVCDYCDRRFYSKKKLLQHGCFIPVAEITCKWCNVKFRTKASLASHARKLHNDLSYSNLSKVSPSQQQKCEVCSESFAHLFQLRYHVRRQHFNMTAPAPCWLRKQVNQVWFEKVLNSNDMMEIRKAGPNTLVMRGLRGEGAGAEPDQATEMLDVTGLYPTGLKEIIVECKLCGKKCRKRNVYKHMEEVHTNKARHRCNNCHATFKRLYLFLKHVCGAQGLPRGVSQARNAVLKIASIESLAPVAKK